MKRIVAGSWLLVSLAGCRGETLTVGSNEGGSSDEGADAACAPSVAAVPEAGPWDSGSSLETLVGTWQGYAEAFTFPSGSDAIRLVVTQAADGSIESTVTYGQGTPPPPASDPDVGYPPGADWADHDGTWLVEGFPFTVTHPSFDGTRLRIQTASTEVWKGWCALQTPTSAGEPCGVYGCLPNWPSVATVNATTTFTDPSSGATETVDYGRSVLCHLPGQPCSCSATACTVDLSTPGDWSFDMQLTGAKLDRTMSGNGNVNVHLTRE
jgi:hypothetical protein